jgi:hypothetical protein
MTDDDIDVRHVVFEDGEWWYVGAADGGRRRLDVYKKKNAKRMFVDGKYIPTSHPLYKPGRYKSFEDAAFSSLRNYKHTKSGYVYVISNPAWKGWVKIGMAIDAEDRLKSYQTSSPYRDYQLLHSVYVTDRRAIERKAHRKIGKIAEEKQNEWFKVDAVEAIDCITAILKKQNSPA